MYRLIENRASPREVYAAELVREKLVTQEEVQAYYNNAVAVLEADTTGLKEFKEPQARTYQEYYYLSRVKPPGTSADRAPPHTHTMFDAAQSPYCVKPSAAR